MAGHDQRGNYHSGLRDATGETFRHHDGLMSPTGKMPQFANPKVQAGKGRSSQQPRPSVVPFFDASTRGRHHQRSTAIASTKTTLTNALLRKKASLMPATSKRE